MPMSETQQLDLELKRLDIEERRRALDAQQPTTPRLEVVARSNGHGG
jgi:hypothetical protein